MRQIWNSILSMFLVAVLLFNSMPWSWAAEQTAAEPEIESPFVNEEPAEAPVQLLADSRTTADGFEYIVSDNAVTITGYTGNAAVLTIPAQIEGLPVTTIRLGHGRSPLCHNGILGVFLGEAYRFHFGRLLRR